jgi:WD40 repeat protein
VYIQILALAAWPGSEELAALTSHIDGTITLWDWRKRKSLATLAQHTDECRSLDFSPGGCWLLSAAFDAMSCIYQTAATGTATAVPLSPQAHGSGSAASSKPWQVKYVGSLKAHTGRVLSARWHPARAAFLTASADCSVMLWTLPQR